jgi:hypothetical protein
MHRMMVVLALGLLVVTPAFATGISDNFESYTLGTFPSPTWLDAGTVLPPTGQTFPSASVVSTTDAFGNATQALGLRDEVDPSRGIYANVPVSAMYSLTADIRVDRYSDMPDSTADDWAMQLTFAEAGVDNFAYTPQAGIYASSQTGGWRFFLIGNTTSADIDLGQKAIIGTWYTVQLNFDVANSKFHSVIKDTATGATLVDEFDTVTGLTSADTAYDSIAFFGGEVSQNTTIADQAVVDNVNISAVGTVPEPASILLLASGLAAFAVGRRRKLPRL